MLVARAFLRQWSIDTNNKFHAERLSALLPLLFQLQLQHAPRHARHGHARTEHPAMSSFNIHRFRIISSSSFPFSSSSSDSFLSHFPINSTSSTLCYSLRMGPRTRVPPFPICHSCVAFRSFCCIFFFYTHSSRACSPLPPPQPTPVSAGHFLFASCHRKMNTSAASFYIFISCALSRCFDQQPRYRCSKGSGRELNKNAGCVCGALRGL